MLKLYWKPLVAVIGFTVLLFAVHGYVEREKQLAEMNAKIQASEEVNKKLEANNQQLQSIVQQVREDANLRVLAIQKQRESIKTPEQAKQVIDKSLPIHAEVSKLPDAPSVLSQEDAKKLADFALAVEQMKVELGALKTENQNFKQQLTNKDAQIAELTKQRDVAVQTAKGGSFWRRTGKAVKFVAIGVGIGLSLGKL